MMMMMVVGVLNFAVPQSTPPCENLANLRIFGLQDPVCCFGEPLSSMEFWVPLEDSQELWLLLCTQGAYTAVQDSQVDHVVVSCSLPMRCIKADVEVRDIAEVLDPLVGPIACQLRCSTDFVCHRSHIELYSFLFVAPFTASLAL